MVLPVSSNMANAALASVEPIPGMGCDVNIFFTNDEIHFHLFYLKSRRRVRELESRMTALRRRQGCSEECGETDS